MVEVTPAVGFFESFSTQHGLMLAGLVGLIVFGSLAWKRGDGVFFVPAVLMIVFVVGLPIPFRFEAISKQAHATTVENLEDVYGVKFSPPDKRFIPGTSKGKSRIVPPEGEYLIVQNVSSSDTTTVYHTIMISREGDMLTLFVPEFEGSEDFIELNLVN